MAHSRIGRNITKTTCKVRYYDNDGNEHNETLELWGEYDVSTIARATRKACKLLGTNQLMIDPSSFTHETKWCSMPLEVFVANADVKEIK